MRKAKENLGVFGGNVCKVQILDSKEKPGEMFGSMDLVLDNGYFNQNANQGQGEYVERPVYVKVKLGNREIKQCNKNISVGDQIVIQANLAMEHWNDKNTGEPRSQLVLNCNNVVAHTTKAEVECLKEAGLYGSQKSSGGIQQQARQGGFQQQQQQGGFQQPQQQGGFQQPQQQGGFQQQQGGFQQQQGGFQQQQGGFRPSPNGQQ